jgi:hypothetical protein
MDQPLSLLKSGREVTVIMATGQALRGRVLSCGHGWLYLAAENGGARLINLGQVAMVDLPGPIGLVDDGALPKPRSKDDPTHAGPTAPGRAWTDAELKALADAFLDQQTDQDLAKHFARARGAIREMRRGFEAARGNLVEDEISPVARTWVARWRKVLAG